MGGKKKQRSSSSKKPEPKMVERDDEVDDSDDEEIDEDEAFDSDDERKYGAFFTSQRQRDTDDRGDDDDSNGDSDDEDVDDDDDDDEEEDSDAGDGGQYMMDLLDRLDEEKKPAAKRQNQSNAVGQQVKESPFAASVLPAANLTLDSLMDGLQDTKGFGNVAKSLKQVAMGKATSAPLDKPKAERIERKLHYEKQTEEITQWIDTVQENRNAETLDFRPKDRLDTTKDVMIDTFTPSTDFEKQLQTALEEAGQKDEKTILAAEEKAITDDLGNNVITMEEYQQRRGRLAKMRALMLYHEQKRAHINKIKSKKYRRIRKRQREKAKEAELADAVEENADVARELEEKEEVDRMKERMTLAHKNTSKWARRVLKRGKNVDADTRRALSAQLKKGDDLLKRMKSRTNAGEDDDDDDSDEDLAESARKVLQETEQEDGAPAKGLFKLAFMQKGVEKQREQAKAEAQRLLEELEEDEHGSDNDIDEEEKEESTPPKKIKVASKEEMQGVIKEGNLVAGALTFGNSTSLTVSGSVSLDVDQPSSSVAKSNLREHSAVLSAEQSDERNATSEKAPEKPGKREDAKSSARKAQPDKESSQTQTPDDNKDDNNRPADKKKKRKNKSTTPNDETADNPWLTAAEASSSSGVSSNKKKRTSRETGLVDVERAADILGNTGRCLPDQQHGDTTLANPPIGEGQKKARPQPPKTIAQLSQGELVRRAFAGVNDQDEFKAEKQRVRDEEDGVLAESKKKSKPDPGTVSGWGSWAGMGAPPAPPPSARRLPARLQAPARKDEAASSRKRQDDRKPKLILREDRLAKTADAYMLQQVPYPYKSREEYERAMMGGIGKEWNLAHKEMTRPEVVTRSGHIIKPLSMQGKRKAAAAARPAAKF